MIAKIIAHAPTREAALDKLASALEGTIAAGPYTNLALLAALCRAAEFRAGNFDTGFIERHMATLSGGGSGDPAAAAFGVAEMLARDVARIGRSLERAPDAPASPWDADRRFSAFRRARISGCRFKSMARPPKLTWNMPPPAPWLLWMACRLLLMPPQSRPQMRSTCCAAGRQTVVRRADLGAGDLDHADGDGEIKAPMHGKVLALLVGNGEQVEKGQRLAIIEAMKMEHTLTAPRAGRVAGIAVSAGSQVAEGARLMTIGPVD